MTSLQIIILAILINCQVTRVARILTAGVPLTESAVTLEPGGTGSTHGAVVCVAAFNPETKQLSFDWFQ